MSVNILNRERIAVILLAVVSALLLYRYLALKQDMQIHQGAPFADSHVDATHRQIASEYAKKYEGRSFPIVEFFELSSNKPVTSNFQDKKSILILFSSHDCSPCLNQELEELQRLYGENTKAVSVIGICTEYQPDKIAIIKKVNRITFPLWYDKDANVSSFVSENKFPFLFLIDKQKIVKAYFPDTR